MRIEYTHTLPLPRKDRKVVIDRPSTQGKIAHSSLEKEVTEIQETTDTSVNNR